MRRQSTFGLPSIDSAAMIATSWPPGATTFVAVS